MKVSVPNRGDWFDRDDGFPRPNWGAINGWMRVFVKEPELDDAWQQLTAHWLDRLCVALGGKYVAEESEHFHLVSEFVSGDRIKSLAFLESSRHQIHKVLGDLATLKHYGKHFVIRFTEADDYYAYIAHFYPDGAFAGSGGMFLNDGYCHIAYPQSWSPDQDRGTVVHELTHNLLVHLPLPPWINEALAMAFETDLAGSRHEPLSRDLAARHRTYWNATTIQQFWCGNAFSDVDGQELAYSLSRILLNLIQTEIRPPEGAFRRFVLAADWGDAGRMAAKEYLDVDLESLIASFLGAGDWVPHPKTWRKELNAENFGEFPEAEENC